MLDIGKLIPLLLSADSLLRFSSMLDIGKLIRKVNRLAVSLRFSSMLDIGKLILKYRSGIDRTFAVTRSIME